MKKALLVLLVTNFFFGACVDKKAEQEKKEATELNKQIEAIDQEIEKETDQALESLEKESQEIENALNELDNL